MSEALIELVFWIIVFIAFFYGFKWLQNRKKKAQAARADSTAHRTESQTPTRQDDA